MSLVIKRAERKNVKVKLAVTGPSGAGKTMGALLLAKGLSNNGRVLVIDTEKSSASLYADNKKIGMGFDAIDIEAPYTVAKYLEALKMGEEAGYDVIVIDSITHQWDGEGGLQDKKHALDTRPGSNSFTNWRGITKEHEQFKSNILHSPCHIVATIRSKQDYVMSTNDKGKQTPMKVGLAPVQREGIEYEFSTVFDVGMDHKFTVSKDRSDLFDGRIEMLTEKTGQEIKAWLASGAPESPKSVVKNKLDIANTITKIYESDDKLGAVELWSELSQEEKDAVRPTLETPIKLWMKSALENAPKMQ